MTMKPLPSYEENFILFLSVCITAFDFTFACALKSCYNLKKVTFMQKALSYPYLP
jgi:hypothetical protein